VNKSYCIFNKQYTKEEYLKKKQDLISNTDFLKKKTNELFSKYPLKGYDIENSKNST
jgi:hypothetical protein